MSSSSGDQRPRGRAVRRTPGPPIWMFLVPGVAALLGVAVVVWVFLSVDPVPIVADADVSVATPSSPDVGIEGVESFGGLPQTHTEQPVTYSQVPPVGGAHHPVWMNCGIYGEPVPEEYAVHSMEHGAVWITYRPDLPVEQVSALRGFALGRSYVLISPFPDLPAPIVASAWGLQLKLDSPGDQRLTQFITAYSQGPQTPEPGAACSGGAGDPIDR